MNAIISVVGIDKPGIIAKISAYLAERNISIEDINQTILSGNFVMMMKVDLSHAGSVFETVKMELEEIGKVLDVSVVIMHEKVFSAMHRI